METSEPTQETKGANSEILKAYQAILEKNGYRRGEIYKRMHVVRCIISGLPKDKPASKAYRIAADLVLISMPDAVSQDMCRQVIRDFFPFFERDVRTIAALSQSGAYEPVDIDIALPSGNLDELIQSARAMELSEREYLTMDGYETALRAQGLDKLSVAHRTTIGLLILLGLRQLPLDGKHYRALLDKLQPLFSREETQTYFLMVAREFYNFVLGDPDAMQKVNQDTTQGAIPTQIMM